MTGRAHSAPEKAGAPGERRITADQFAFLRAVILGVPLEDAAERYLQPGMDLRLVKRELRWLRTELLAAARRAHAWGDARALSLDMAQLPTGKPVASKPAPSLEDFQAEVDPGGEFYTEKELLELYRERYPPAPADRRGGRVARLRERQRRSLATLEHVLVQPPTRDDPPSAWLEPAVAQRLEAVGLDTLGKLGDWIVQRGHLWHTVVPKLGAIGARRVVDWIDRNSQALDVHIDPALQMTRAELIEASQTRQPIAPPASPATAPIRPPSASFSVASNPQGLALVPAPERRPLLARIVPLERLVVPAALDGSRGTNRIESVHALRAANDIEAIEAWITAVAAGNAETERAYRRESERLVLWAVFEPGVPMSSLTTEDAAAYREFLADPQPSDRWVSRRGGIRLSPAWRPFRGPLAGRSIAYAITVLTALFDWLVQEHYLVRNIWRGLPRRRTIHAAAEADPDRLVPEAKRWLTTAQWGVMRSVLGALGTDEEDRRMRLVCLLAYTTGLRLSELVDARIGRLEAIVGDEDESEAAGDVAVATPVYARHVVLRVRGKGNKLRSVPIVPQVEDELNAYLATRGLPVWTELEDLAAEDSETFGWLRGVPLIAQLRHSRRRRSMTREKQVPDAGEVPKVDEALLELVDRAGHPIDRRQDPLSTKRVYQIVRAAFERGAIVLKKRGHHRDAEVFSRASTHWLRHTFGRHAATAKPHAVPINIIQALLGHASLQTTTIYTSDDGTEAWDAVRAFTKKRV